MAHQADAAGIAMLAAEVVTGGEVVLGGDLYARRHIPEDIHCAENAILVLGELRGRAVMPGKQPAKSSHA